MNEYTCINKDCGHIVLAEETPQPIRWTDGHVCYFKLVVKEEPKPTSKVTMKQVKEKIHADTYSQKDGVFTLRWGFFYRMGKDVKTYEAKVKEAFPNAKIVLSGEVWKAFRGGASVANSSHWYVKFTL